jgi:hypothetical protein
MTRMLECSAVNETNLPFADSSKYVQIAFRHSQRCCSAICFSLFPNRGMTCVLDNMDSCKAVHKCAMADGSGKRLDKKTFCIERR